LPAAKTDVVVDTDGFASVSSMNTGEQSFIPS
jgi:hypothetical protein